MSQVLPQGFTRGWAWGATWGTSSPKASPPWQNRMIFYFFKVGVDWILLWISLWLCPWESPRKTQSTPPLKKKIIPLKLLKRAYAFHQSMGVHELREVERVKRLCELRQVVWVERGCMSLDRLNEVKEVASVEVDGIIWGRLCEIMVSVGGKQTDAHFSYKPVKNFAKRETSPQVCLVTRLFWSDDNQNVGGCRSGPKDSKNI